jgi:hypothetical protein
MNSRSNREKRAYGRHSLEGKEGERNERGMKRRENEASGMDAE